MPSLARPGTEGSSEDGMNEQMSLKSLRLQEGRDRVKEEPLGAQGPDSQPEANLTWLGVSGGLRLGSGVWCCVLDDSGQYWPVPRSELAQA